MESLQTTEIHVEAQVQLTTQTSTSDDQVAEIVLGIETMVTVQASSDETPKSSRSNEGSDEESPHKYPTFTNEVIIIRPQTFYENEEAHADNKFMKFSGLKRQDTNSKV